MTIFSLVDRYETAKQQLGEASRIADIRAPRFINMPDWIAGACKKNFVPHPIYGTAVWDNWDQTAISIGALASQNYQTQTAPAVSLELLAQVNRSSSADAKATGSGAYGFRTNIEMGGQIWRKDAPTLQEIQVLNELSPLIIWRGSQCVEDLSKENRGWFKRDRRFFVPAWFRDAGKDFVRSDGQTRHCGWLTYSSADRIQEPMTRYLSNLQADLQRVSNGSVDFLEVAARAQRDLVAIHPYSIGNGRTSRLVMDLILQSYGLPAPNLANQNTDLSTSLRPWAQAIGTGVVRVVEKLKFCVKLPNDIWCKRI